LTDASPNTSLVLLKPGMIGGLEMRNRFVRSAVSETLAGDDGVVLDPAFRDFYARLAEGGAGLLFTGHCFVHPRGKYGPGQTGIVSRRHAEPLARVAASVQASGARFFPQLTHAGSQSLEQGIELVAPSAVENPQVRRTPRAASTGAIEEVIEAFGRAAALVKWAGVDGIHLHAGHGYLLSSFLSPYSNRREDDWGGSLENRQRLLVSVVRAVRQEAPGLPVTVKLGMRDFVPNGLTLEDAIDTGRVLEREGVSAIDVSAGLTSPLPETVQTYTGVTRRRAAEDKLVHRLFSSPGAEGYFVPEARALRAEVSLPLMVTGGLRTTGFMESLLRDDVVDFVSLGRPLIREPDLPNQVAAGRRGLVDCTSCNICLMHDGVHPLRCWRTSVSRLAVHAAYRVSGRLGHQ
jgi:2,4-dienoyl-CoA reductase-like NADH-dependent reductase (Old Yellow Enzyme family)